MYNRKKGFTLLELLCVILVLTLLFIVSFSLVINILDKSKNTVDEISKKMILEAVEKYAIEYGNTDKWNQEVNYNGIISSCVTIDSLFNYGYFKNNESIAEKYKDKYFVKITKLNGMIEYELYEIEKINNICRYYDNETNINKGGSFVDIKENGSDKKLGSLEYSVTKITDRKFNTDINFKINFEINDVVKIIIPPTYVMMVLDRSGSMSGNKYTKAKEATINFSKKILDSNNVPEAKIGLITYASDTKLSRSFENKDLSRVSFEAASGLTYTGDAIKRAKKTIENSVKEDDASVFTILLFDGYPNDGSALINAATTLKNVGSKLIVVGYEFSAKEELKKIATKDSNFCVGSSYKDYCYYDSDIINIDGLFSNLSTTITETVKSTNVKEANVILDSPILENGEKVFKIEKDGKTVDEIKENITIEHDKTFDYSITDSYNLIINEKFFEGCITNSVCSGVFLILILS